MSGELFLVTGGAGFLGINLARHLLARGHRVHFVSAYSNRDALIRNYDWYVANCERIRGTSGISHRVPWKQDILRLAKRLF